ncbi:unnamed protein product [Sphagnum troendelagicum]|uniref:Uncharacterized protein n=1 Tax=Sphagnum troendelagicum TaxID=128251 RepID=A0ABP0UEC8_9BRYO
MKEEVKPSRNEWVTFIVFIRVFLHLRSLLQAPEIRNAEMEQQNRQRKLEGKDKHRLSHCAAQVDDGKVSRVSRRDIIRKDIQGGYWTTFKDDSSGRFSERV